MSFYLITHNPNPPGGLYIRIWFRDGVETISDALGDPKDGCLTFGPWPEASMVAKEWGEFRKANTSLPSDNATLLPLIDEFTCKRLGNSPRFCKDTEQSYATVGAVPLTPAGGGGGCCGRAKL